MAITFIYSIKSTPKNSIEYNKSDKESEIINKKNNTLDSLNYIMRDKKGNISELSKEYLEKMKPYITIENNKVIFETISTAINCSLNNANEQWNLVREKYKRKKRPNEKENLQYCIVQNFGDSIDPLIANEIGVKFAQEYLKDYQCIVSTHINTGYVHNHIEFNATSFLTGKKYHDCLKSISDIRKISDKLCEKYNLKILEDTRNVNMIKYKDSNGKIKFFEPTKRKSNILEGEYSNKNDYRNTVQFGNSEKSKESHLNIIREDIKKIIPFCKSYEDFIVQMQNIGYEVRAKNKNGEWRKHTSFKEATWDKFTRDSSLGEEYVRENIIKTIEKNLSKKKENKVSSNDMFIQNNNLIYNSTIINQMDIDYRYKKNKEGFEKIRRSNIEKYILMDTKKMNNEIDNMIRESLKVSNEKKQILSVNSKKKQYLIDRINGNLKTLQFVEDKNLTSFNQIQDIVNTLYKKRNRASDELNIIAGALRKANRNIVIINKFNDLKETMLRNSINNSNEYNMYEKENDEKLLQSYESELSKLNLLAEDRQKRYIEKFNNFSKSFEQLCSALEKINTQIKEYDDCVFNIGYVDKKNQNLYKNEIEKYYKEKESDRERNNNDEKER